MFVIVSSPPPDPPDSTELSCSSRNTQTHPLHFISDHYWTTKRLHRNLRVAFELTAVNSADLGHVLGAVFVALDESRRRRRRCSHARLECGSLVRRAISVSSVYFSIALNSIIMRRRWLHYQRRVIGPFHQLLATHCAKRCSASLAINRCDLIIKQGGGENILVLLFLFIYFFSEHASPPGRWVKLQICAWCHLSDYENVWN